MKSTDLSGRTTPSLASGLVILHYTLFDSDIFVDVLSLQCSSDLLCLVAVVCVLCQLTSLIVAIFVSRSSAAGRMTEIL